MLTPENFTKISHDVNGNPRYVCHFLHLLTEAERANAEGIDFVSRQYAIAVKRANRFGGRKYHTRSYGGGVVFSSYALGKLCNEINKELKG